MIYQETGKCSPSDKNQEVNSEGKRVLCRTENFANSHNELNDLLRGERMLSVLGQLASEDMLLFKEKINYKFAGSGGFTRVFTDISAIYCCMLIATI